MPLPKNTAGYSEELTKLIHMAALKFERGENEFQFPLKQESQATNLRFRFYGYRKALQEEAVSHPDPAHQAECFELAATALYMRMKIVKENGQVFVKIVNTKTDNDEALSDMGAALDNMFEDMGITRGADEDESMVTEMGIEIPTTAADLFTSE